MATIPNDLRPGYAIQAQKFHLEPGDGSRNPIMTLCAREEMGRKAGWKKKKDGDQIGWVGLPIHQATRERKRRVA